MSQKEPRVRILFPLGDTLVGGKKLEARLKIDGDKTYIPVIANGRVDWQELGADDEHLLEENGFLHLDESGTPVRLSGFAFLSFKENDIFFLINGSTRNESFKLAHALAVADGYIVSTARCAGQPVYQTRLTEKRLAEFFFLPDNPVTG